MMEIKLIDSNIRHIPSFNGYDEPKNITWYRGNDHKDVIVFSDHHISHVGYYSGKYRIAWLMEPVAINSNSYNAVIGLQNHFDYIISHDLSFLAQFPKEKQVWAPGSGTSLYSDQWAIYPKSKDILTVVGDKRSTEGHRFRHEVVEKFGDRIDVVGRGYAPFPPEKRVSIYAPYKFQIVIHNCAINDYWTDILTDCFLTGTVPIVWKGSYIYKYFNLFGCFIFENLDDLNKIVDLINEDGENIYKSMLPSVQCNFETIKKYAVVEDYLYENFFKQFDESITDIS